MSQEWVATFRPWRLLYCMLVIGLLYVYFGGSAAFLGLLLTLDLTFE